MVTRIDIVRHGRAMARPVTGFVWGGVRDAFAADHPRLRFAHADVSGFSLFEEGAVSWRSRRRAYPAPPRHPFRQLAGLKEFHARTASSPNSVIASAIRNCCRMPGRCMRSASPFVPNRADACRRSLSSVRQPCEEPAGATGAVVLAESHLAVHTWPELAAGDARSLRLQLPARDNSAAARQAWARLLAAFAPGVAQRGSNAARLQRAERCLTQGADGRR